MEQIQGKQSLAFANPPYIQECACVAGKKEGEGPFGQLFDKVELDELFGSDSWEQAESALQFQTVNTLLEKAKLQNTDVRYLFAGDLLGQLIASSFGLMQLEIPFFGIYGACSTMGEALMLSSMTVSAGYAERVIAAASSHFASAEKTFRFPLDYGNQRPLSATWTVTGCGSVLLGTQKGFAKITGVTPGKIVDYGVKDSMNMGACMAPAAADTIYTNLTDFGRKPDDYDRIITGDLGIVGQRILFDLLKEKGIDISNVHMDCGIEIYNNREQDTHSGGSGCGCSAITLCSFILKKIREKKWKRVLFVPTGALLSPVSFNEGQSVPGIAHGVIIEKC